MARGTQRGTSLQACAFGDADDYTMPIDFQAFDPHRRVRIYRRNLPHWRQDGATYFVTCRLHDSLPQHAIDYLETLRRVLIRMAERDADPIRADREYFRKMKHYLDQGHGACWLRDPAIQEVVRQAVAHFEGVRYQAGESAVLPNHLHALVRPLPGFELEDILHSWKTFIARAINRHVGRTGPVWQHENYDRLVRDTVEFARTERYIRNNLLPPQKRES